MTRTQQDKTPKAPSGDTNLVVVVGTVQKDAVVTEATDGRIYTSFDVVCRLEGIRTVVPVTVARSLDIPADTRVAVLGRVEKRFFPSGAGFMSRSDVRAESVTVLRRSSQLSRVLAVAIGHLSGT
ncbi:MAG: hypothetical protein ACO36A_09785 [Ilumatobacteraceae bacterium]